MGVGGLFGCKNSRNTGTRRNVSVCVSFVVKLCKVGSQRTIFLAHKTLSSHHHATLIKTTLLPKESLKKFLPMQQNLNLEEVLGQRKIGKSDERKSTKNERSDFKQEKKEET